METWDELKKHLHPILGRRREHVLLHFGFDFVPGSGQIESITIKIKSHADGQTLTLRFVHPHLDQFGELRLPEFFGSPIAIVDIGYRGMEDLKIEVIGDYEEGPHYFFAESVEVVT